MFKKILYSFGLFFIAAIILGGLQSASAVYTRYEEYLVYSTNTTTYSLYVGSEKYNRGCSSALWKNTVENTYCEYSDFTQGKFGEYIEEIDGELGFDISDIEVLYIYSDSDHRLSTDDLAYIDENFTGLNDLYVYAYCDNDKIPDGAFDGNTNLKYVHFEYANTIGNAAFQDCEKLVTVSMASSDITIEPYAFSGCDSLTTISSFSDSVVSLGNNAFEDCIALTGVSFDALVTVPTCAFEDCLALTSVEIENAETIGQAAFSKCTSLTEISMPYVTEIVDHAFGYCTSLESVTFENLVSIGQAAFYRCTSLKRLYLGSTPPTVGGNAFFNCAGYKAVYVPEGSKSTYKTVSDGSTTDNYWYEWQIAGSVSFTVGLTEETDFYKYDGSITVNVQGGVGPYTYSIAGDGLEDSYSQTLNVFTGLAQGDYTITVVDYYGETMSQSVVFEGPPQLEFYAIRTTACSCYSVDDGTITVSVDSTVYNPCEFGICLYDDYYTLFLELAAKELAGEITERELCQQLQTCFEFEDDAGYSCTFTGLSPDSYVLCIRVENNRNNYQFKWIAVSGISAVTYSVSCTNITSYGSSAGGITISNTSGGFGSYQYSFNGGETWGDDAGITGLHAGTYKIIVRDPDETVNSTAKTVTITQPDKVTAVISSTNATSAGRSDGSITVTASGGNATYGYTTYGGYEYSIDGGATWQDAGEFSKLSAGAYDVRVRDSYDTGNVSESVAVTITCPGQVSISVEKEDISSTTEANGTITVTASGGNGTYEYSKDGGVTWQNSNTFTGLDAGTYTVMARDKADTGNSSSAVSVTISRPDSVSVNLSDLTLSDGTLSPEFDKYTATYQVAGADSLSSITITAVTDETSSALTINGDTAQSGVGKTVALESGANLIYIAVTSPDGDNQKTYVLSINGTSSDADLSSLTVSAGSLSFDSDTTEYTVDADNVVDSIDVGATASDSGATVLINGAAQTSATIALNIGKNTITVIVVAQDATTKTYTVTVNRASGDASLSGITLSQGALNPVFSADITEYTAQVPYTAETLTITPALSDSNATVTVNGADSTAPAALATGENTVQIVVTGADGITTNTYTLTVTRLEELVIETESLPVGFIGAEYSATLTALLGSTPYTWKATGLPTELTLDTSTGKITGTPQTSGSYTVVITVTDADYSTATLSLTLKLLSVCGNGAYIIRPADSEVYSAAYTDAAIPVMTVNEGYSGSQYFCVSIEAVAGHDGSEICLFIHMRDGIQQGLFGYYADYDSGKSIQACLDVKPGDTVYVFIVDDLDNSTDTNPAIL